MNVCVASMWDYLSGIGPISVVNTINVCLDIMWDHLSGTGPISESQYNQCVCG